LEEGRKDKANGKLLVSFYALILLKANKEVAVAAVAGSWKGTNNHKKLKTSFFSWKWKRCPNGKGKGKYKRNRREGQWAYF
jgi:hypothetical protein